MIHKKKLKSIDNNYNQSPVINLRDRQNNYIDLFRNSLKSKTVDLKMTDEEGLQKSIRYKKRYSYLWY